MLDFAQNMTRVQLKDLTHYTWYRERFVFPVTVDFPAGAYAPLVESDAQKAEEELCDLASAMEYNPSPILSTDIRAIAVIQRGSNDGDDWIWMISTSEGPGGSYPDWIATGGCDYTGWDCQSDLRWYSPHPQP